MSEPLTKPALWSLWGACVATAGIGALDYATGNAIGFSIFYLAPVAWATRAVGLRGGLLVSVLSTAAWYVADSLTSPLALHPLIPAWNALMRCLIFVGAAWLLAHLIRALALAEILARTDPLTGAWNTRAFFELAERELARSRRYGHVLSVAYMDLDHFKTVNDEHGHAEGDRLLQAVAATLREGLRGTDHLARLGGDEFALLLPETNEADGRALVERLRTRVRALTEAQGWPISISSGFVSAAAPLPEFGDLLRRADARMYEAKQHGRDTVVSEDRGGGPATGGSRPTP